MNDGSCDGANTFSGHKTKRRKNKNNRLYAVTFTEGSVGSSLSMNSMDIFSLSSYFVGAENPTNKIFIGIFKVFPLYSESFVGVRVLLLQF